MFGIQVGTSEILVVTSSPGETKKVGWALKGNVTPFIVQKLWGFFERNLCATSLR